MSTKPEPQPIHAWKRRLAFLQEQEAVVSDPAQKFTLREQIAEAQAKLRELAGTEETGQDERLAPTPPPRDESFARGSTEGGKTFVEWDVFISHASEDKFAVVRPLAGLLEQQGLRVWLDEAELRLGDSLRQKIEEGLSRSRFGVVILSPSFFSKNWPQKELDGLFAREEGGVKVVLPVWHSVSQTDVALRSPLLAGRLAVKTELGIAAVAAEICRAVGAPGASKRRRMTEHLRQSSASIPPLQAGPTAHDRELSVVVEACSQLERVTKDMLVVLTLVGAYPDWLFEEMNNELANMFSAAEFNREQIESVLHSKNREQTLRKIYDIVNYHHLIMRQEELAKFLNSQRVLFPPSLWEEFSSIEGELKACRQFFDAVAESKDKEVRFGLLKNLVEIQAKRLPKLSANVRRYYGLF